MGAAESAGQAGKKAAQSVLRQAGDPLNTLGWPVAHEKVFSKPTGKAVRYTICRCWQSLRFPLCDNSHQRLQKQGIHCGPVMFEVRAGPVPVGACEGSCKSSGPVNLGGPQAAALGGLSATALFGIAHWTGMGPL
mmetsp:Transcript_80289/g.146450  ORF Transcript_80289/g.146450 Transcript_80289/m.146450 type:complete len:135 (+) Transcript_80289:65-469(+)